MDKCHIGQDQKGHPLNVLRKSLFVLEVQSPIVQDFNATSCHM